MKAVRRFTGPSDELLLALGNCDINEAVTLAVFFRPNDATAEKFPGMFFLRNSAEVIRGYGMYRDSAQAVFWLWPEAEYTVYSGTETTLTDEDWFVAVITKAAGEVKPRWHLYSFTESEAVPTETWEHADHGEAVPNAGSVTGGDIQIGVPFSSNEPTDSTDLAAVAIWDSVLTDEQIETLVDKSQGIWKTWGDLEPKGFWTFEQESTETAVSDRTGGEADQTSLTGTEVIAEHPAVRYEGLELPENTEAPSISGTAKPGETLTADEGEWVNDVESYAFQWQTSPDGESAWINLPGATEKTYVVQEGDSDRNIRVVVTATNDTGSTEASSADVEAIVMRVFDGASWKAGKPYVKTRGLVIRQPGLLFRGDQVADFASIDGIGEITEVADPLGSGETVFKLVVPSSDPEGENENARVQALSEPMMIEGSEFWARGKLLLPDALPDEFPGWMSLTSTYEGAPETSGASPFRIQANGTTLQWQRNTTYEFDVPWARPLSEVFGRWVSFVWRESLSEDAEKGYIELWVDGEKITFFDPENENVFNPNEEAATDKLFLKTLDETNNGEPNYVKIMSYKQGGKFEETTIYHGPLSVLAA